MTYLPGGSLKTQGAICWDSLACAMAAGNTRMVAGSVSESSQPALGRSEHRAGGLHRAKEKQAFMSVAPSFVIAASLVRPG